MSRSSGTALEALIEAELGRPLPAELGRLVEAILQRHGDAVEAILFYGSCLRDGVIADRLVDLHVLVRSYAAVHEAPLMRWLNRAVPPNVYHLQVAGEADPLRAKYAIVETAQLAELVGRRTSNPYFWARYAQPMALAWSAGPEVTGRVAAILAEAVRTLLAQVRPLVPEAAASDERWCRAFALTYATELRSEGADRARQLYEADRARYDAVDRLVAAEPGPPADPARLARLWRRRQATGKLWSVLRLVKAGFTFEGGADYLAWKIGRHSGVEIEVTDWHRRHPHLAAVTLFWRLYRRGAFR